VSAERALAEAALEIARERAAVLDRARQALLRGDETEALRCLRILTGLEEDNASPDPEPAT